jgi:hypothetical protein
LGLEEGSRWSRRLEHYFKGSPGGLASCFVAGNCEELYELNMACGGCGNVRYEE